MKHTHEHITDADLHAYVDDEQTAERRAAVENYLAEHPEEAEAVRVWQRQNEAIRALHDRVAAEPVPDHLNPHLIASRLASRNTTWRSLAAAAVLVTLGVALGWSGRGMVEIAEDPALPLVRQAMTAHAVYTVEVRHPVEVGSDQQQHLVAWLSKRLDHPLRAPDLQAEGFQLVGGRLLPASDGPAAQFMYEDKSGQRITLYVTRNTTGQLAAFRFASADSQLAFYWLDADVSYALVGKVSREALQSLVMRVYEELS